MADSKTLVAATMFSCVALTGCSSPPSAPAPSSPTSAFGTVGDVDPAKCQIVASLPVAVNAPSFVVVDDATASSAATDLPPGLLAALQDAQATGLVLQVIGVNGPGGAPIITPAQVLDPQPGNDSDEAAEARGTALRCAQLALLDTTRITPTSPGSDPVRAVLTALKQHPKTLVVASDGVPVGGLLGVDVVGWDMPVKDLADAAATAYPVPDGTAGVSVTWVNLGRTRTALPEWAPKRLEASLRAVMPGVHIDFDTRLGADRPTPPADQLPADAIPVPKIGTVTWTGPVGCQPVPDALLFYEKTAELKDPPALEKLAAQLADQLAAQPDWGVHVAGHTADYGTYDGRKLLSQQRADAVAAAIRAALDARGLANPVTTSAHGSTRPAVPEYRPDGSHDTAAAAANRRVSLLIGPVTAITKSVATLTC